MCKFQSSNGEPLACLVSLPRFDWFADDQISPLGTGLAAPDTVAWIYLRIHSVLYFPDLLAEMFQ